VDFLIRERVGRVGERAGLGVGIHVGRSVLVPFKMTNETRYVVPTCPFTVAETAWELTWNFCMDCTILPHKGYKEQSSQYGMVLVNFK
jgi:hypothetical protein